MIRSSFPAGRFRSGRVVALVVAVMTTLGLEAAPAAAHDCGARNAKPSCVDYGTIFIQNEAQMQRSRPLGHYCEDGKETLTSRIEVTFSNVSQHSGHLQKITVYFDGDNAYHLGALDAYGPKNEFHYQDHRTSYPPGSSLDLYPDKDVNLGDGSFVVAHKPWKGMMTGVPGAPRSAVIPCSGPAHEFLLRVREHTPRDPCRDVKPPGPC